VEAHIKAIFIIPVQSSSRCVNIEISKSDGKKCKAALRQYLPNQGQPMQQRFVTEAKPRTEEIRLEITRAKSGP